MLSAKLRKDAMRFPRRKRGFWLAGAAASGMWVFYLVAGPGYSSVGSNMPPRIRLPEPEIASPVPEPLMFKSIAPGDAVAYNNAIPISDMPNPPARPFLLAKFSTPDAQRSLDCLTAAIYYEAATESEEGQRAVAQVVLNRVRHPAFPKSICAVVFQGSERSTGCQFTFTCDGSLSRAPVPFVWNRARGLALAALAGRTFLPVGWATHYHTNWVVPYWSASLVKLANVGTHVFFRWEGRWGQPRVFSDRYAEIEPVIAEMTNIGPAEIGEPALAGPEPFAPEARETDIPVIAAYAPNALGQAVIRRVRGAGRMAVTAHSEENVAAGAITRSGTDKSIEPRTSISEPPAEAIR